MHIDMQLRDAEFDAVWVCVPEPYPRTRTYRMLALRERLQVADTATLYVEFSDGRLVGLGPRVH